MKVSSAALKLKAPKRTGRASFTKALGLLMEEACRDSQARPLLIIPTATLNTESRSKLQDPKPQNPNSNITLKHPLTRKPHKTPKTE